ncbi:MAG: hypothetical protein M3R12_08445, partial [Actinomycetota bacterium]|nr:hypothetical protein [Actinomycetota bacterium]
VNGALLPLASLFSRFEALRGAPRVAGAIGAAALAVGVSASGPATADSLAERPARPQLATVVARAVPTRLLQVETHEKGGASCRPRLFLAGRQA